MKYLIIGDIHAGKKTRNSRNGEVFHKVLKDYAHWVKQVALENNIQNIIQMGDVFDNRNAISLETLDYVTQFFDILEEFHIDIVVGNHDALLNDNASINSLTPFKKHPNITVHDKVTVQDDMVFAGWGVKLDDFPPCKLFFGHIDTVGFELQKNRIATHGFKASDLMDKVSGAVFTGHYHLPQVRHYSGKPFCYTGSAFSLDWNDIDNTKYVYILDTDTLEVKKIENIVSPRFYHINNESQLGLISGNFISIDYVMGEVGEKWKSKVLAMNPLELRTNTIREKVQQIENEIAEFKVVDIKETLGSWPMENLANLSEDLKKRVAEKCQKMYDKAI